MPSGKKELAGILAEKTGATQKQTAEFIDAFIETVEEKLIKGDKIQLTGFGTFMTKRRESRPGRNPATGEKITIPASTAPVFNPGKNLKKKVNS